MTNLESKCWELHSQQECCAPECGIIEDPDSIYQTVRAQDTDHIRRSKFLDDVADLINGDRERDYGKASENFNRIAMMWSGYFGDEITEHDVAACLALLKIARLATSPHHKDSWKDLAGYATLGGTL